MISLKIVFFAKGTTKHRKTCCRCLMLLCLLVALHVTPVFGQESPEKVASGGHQIKSWFGRITAQYEAASARAEALLAKAQASVANSRNIYAQSKLSANITIRGRAEKALANAVAVQKKAQADLLASRSALAVLNEGSPETTSGAPLAFVALGEDVRYMPSNKNQTAATAFFGINPGDRLETGPAGKARLHLVNDGLENEIQLGPGSRMVVQHVDGDAATTSLILEQGTARIIDTAQTAEARAAAEKHAGVLDGFFRCLEKKDNNYAFCASGYLRYWVKRKNRFEIRTPAVAIAVRGTEYLMGHDGATGVTTLKVLEGGVALLSDRHGQALLVEAGQGARADAAGLSLLAGEVDAAAERSRWEE